MRAESDYRTRPELGTDGFGLLLQPTNKQSLLLQQVLAGATAGGRDEVYGRDQAQALAKDQSFRVFLN